MQLFLPKMIFRGQKSSKSIGEIAEDKALVFLQNQGLFPVARNYKVKVGEIDLIMREGSILVFVEVKFRKNSRFGSPLETVDGRKQEKVRAAAQHFVLEKKIAESQALRFDVVGIENDTVQWIKNAF